MAWKKKFIMTIIISLAVASLVAEVLLVAPASGLQQTYKLYTYPVSVRDKLYTITVQTNSTQTPSVELTNASSGEYHVLLDFLEPAGKRSIFFSITIPTDFLWGNISLIWKYYLQSPASYILSNNGTHNSIQKTFNNTVPFSGWGHFEIWGTEGAWSSPMTIRAQTPTPEPTLTPMASATGTWADISFVALIFTTVASVVLVVGGLVAYLKVRR